jgi:hypothetical protein
MRCRFQNLGSSIERESVERLSEVLGERIQLPSKQEKQPAVLPLTENRS